MHRTLQHYPVAKIITDDVHLRDQLLCASDDVDLEVHSAPLGQ